MAGASDYTSVKVRRFTESGKENEAVEEISDLVVTEASLTVLHRDVRANLPSCSPSSAGYLAVGHLVSRGLIRSSDRVVGLEHLPGENVIRVRTERVPQQEELLEREFRVSFSPGAICSVLDDLLQRSSLFKMTGASHAAALCDDTGILCWHEDIGRHNAVDKTIGHGFLEGILLGDKMLALTGRINSEIVEKVVSAGIPALASKAPPTDLAVRIAERAGVTVIGFVRNRRLAVYSCPERLAPAGA